MNRIFAYLAPQTAVDGIFRCLLVIATICLINVVFAYAYDEAINLGVSFFVLQGVVVGGPFAVLFFVLTTFQLKLIRRLSLLSRKDGLTGLNNRRTFMELAKKRLARTGTGVLLLLDADHFKGINDRYGHATGDQCLQNIAHRLNWNLRDNDVAGRIGGEEFAILLCCATIEQGRVIAERIGQPIPFDVENSELHNCLTLSIGMVVLDPLVTLDCHFQRADEALYAAKDAGRSCFRIWKPEEDKPPIRLLS